MTTAISRNLINQAIDQLPETAYGELVQFINSLKTPYQIAKTNRETALDLRPIGLCKGEFVVPDDFDEPLPEDILASFEGK